MNNYNASKKLQKEQSNLIDKLHNMYKIPPEGKGHEIIARIINIEYILTMLDEGHDYKTLDIYKANNTK